MAYYSKKGNYFQYPDIALFCLKTNGLKLININNLVLGNQNGVPGFRFSTLATIIYSNEIMGHLYADLINSMQPIINLTVEQYLLQQSIYLRALQQG